MTHNKRERNMDVLRPKALEQIYAHASRSYPEECCGFVFADGSVYLGSNIQNELHRKNPEIYPRTAANGYTFSVADTLLLNNAFRCRQPGAEGRNPGLISTALKTVRLYRTKTHARYSLFPSA